MYNVSSQKYTQNINNSQVITDSRGLTVMVEREFFTEKVNAKFLENNLHNLIIWMWFEETSVWRLLQVGLKFTRF